MPKFKNYTKALVERQIRAIIRRNPDNVNPTDGLDCLYIKGRGRNIKRCLVGQWGYEQGFTTPQPINGGVEEVVQEIWAAEANFDPAAVKWLSAIQSKADGDWSAPIPWKDVELSA